mgnify:FL=1|jgi:hypothetical protein|tara:strand:- start:657 stop:890 length:234 start_codon:yes stop_codon:yes gene_type:complete
MTHSELTSLIREVIQEMNEANVTSTGGASFTPGEGETFATPKFKGKGHRAKKTLTKMGWKQTKRPKRPSHTKGFDYL